MRMDGVTVTGDTRDLGGRKTGTKGGVGSFISSALAESRASAAAMVSPVRRGRFRRAQRVATRKASLHVSVRRQRDPPTDHQYSPRSAA